MDVISLKSDDPLIFIIIVLREDCFPFFVTKFLGFHRITTNLCHFNVVLDWKEVEIAFDIQAQDLTIYLCVCQKSSRVVLRNSSDILEFSRLNREANEIEIMAFFKAADDRLIFSNCVNRQLQKY